MGQRTNSKGAAGGPGSALFRPPSRVDPPDRLSRPQDRNPLDPLDIQQMTVVADDSVGGTAYCRSQELIVFGILGLRNCWRVVHAVLLPEQRLDEAAKVVGRMNLAENEKCFSAYRLAPDQRSAPLDLVECVSPL
jgi:hypothetical protein